MAAARLADRHAVGFRRTDRGLNLIQRPRRDDPPHAGAIQLRLNVVDFDSDRRLVGQCHGDHGQCGVDAVLPVACRMDEPHAGRTALEPVDRTGVRDHPDAGRRHGGSDRLGDLMVLTHQDAGSDLNEMDPRAERVEDRCHLHAGRASADHDQRRRHRGKVPRVAVCRGQVEAGNRQRP